MWCTVASEPASIRRKGRSWEGSYWSPDLWRTRPLTSPRKSNITGRWLRGWWSLSRRIKRCLSEPNPVKRDISGKDVGSIYSMKHVNRHGEWRLLDSPVSQVWPSDHEAKRLKHSCDHSTLQLELRGKEWGATVTTRFFFSFNGTDRTMGLFAIAALEPLCFLIAVTTGWVTVLALHHHHEFWEEQWKERG